MVPLLIWDLVWILLIAPQLKEGGLCALCILAYFLQAYFFAGFCEEVTKFLVISRLTNSALTTDWRAMMVYGICAGCGFATAENIAYVFSGGFATAIARAFVSVPLHCCTGAIIALEIARRRPIAVSCPSLTRGMGQWDKEGERGGDSGVYALECPACFLYIHIMSMTTITPIVTPHPPPLSYIWTVIWPVLLAPWLIHGTFDFLLMLGEGSHSSLGILGFLGALLVFLAGLAFCRDLSFRVRETEASYGRLAVDIHQRIEAGQVC